MVFDTFRKIILNVTTLHDLEGERAVTRNMVNINRFDSYPRTDYGMMSQNVQAFTVVSKEEIPRGTDSPRSWELARADRIFQYWRLRNMPHLKYRNCQA